MQNLSSSSRQPEEATQNSIQPKLRLRLVPLTCHGSWSRSLDLAMRKEVHAGAVHFRPLQRARGAASSCPERQWAAGERAVCAGTAECAAAAAAATPATLAGQDSTAHEAVGRTSCHCKLCTYNTLSVQKRLQRNCLAAALRRFDIDIMGLQESRICERAVDKQDGILKLAGPVVQGQEGCQLWVRVDGPRPWDPSAFVIAYAWPRLLVVYASLGSVRLAFFVGHAHTSVSTEEQIREFWDLCEQRLAALPPGATPIMLLDCNYRFQGPAGQLRSTNFNAQCFAELCAKYSLCHTGIHDCRGSPLRTWLSPHGLPACLDFIAVPAHWAHGFGGQKTVDFLDMHAETDHWPLCLREATLCTFMLLLSGLESIMTSQLFRRAFRLVAVTMSASRCMV